MKLKIGTDEWLEWRRTKITATDAPIIMKDSPWCTPYQLFEKKSKGLETPISAAMQRGIDLEPIARDLFIEMTGLIVFPDIMVADNEWMAATFDGINEKGTVVEIKCPNIKDHEEALMQRVPRKYYAQCQHQMLVAGVEKMFYVSYNPDHDIPFVHCMVTLDKDYCKNLVAKEREFYEKLMSFEGPDKTQKDEEYETIVDEEFLKDEEMLRDYEEKLKEWTRRKDELREKMLSKIRFSKAKGKYFSFVQQERKGSIDYSKIPQLRDVDLEIYRKNPSINWVIREY